jgi:MFS family permease
MTTTSSQTSSVPQLKAQRVIVRHQHAFFYGWWVVAASAVGLFWGPAVTVYSFSVFLKPLMQEFHAGRATIALGYTLHLMAAAVCAPVIGLLVDRYGSRRVILSATAMFASILLLNKVLTTNLWQFYLFYVALGLLINGVGPIP